MVGSQHDRQSLPLLPARYVQINDLLTPDEHSQMLEYALHHTDAFAPTTTSTDTADYRQSLVLYDPAYADRVTNRITEQLPSIVQHLVIPPFVPTQMEAQLTAHNDGHYYKLHNDNGSPQVADRVLTYVYYFYREPKAFSGGELRLYDSKVEQSYYVHAPSFKTVEPRNNSLVLFPSFYLHEVLPICCPSQNFADSRFTINGWISAKRP